MNQPISLFYLLLYWLWTMPVLADKVPYTDGSYMALRLIGALFCTPLGLTFCFFGQDMSRYTIFFAGLELFSVFAFILAFPVAELEDQQIMIYFTTSAITITLILSLLAAKFIKFGKIVLGVNFTISLWLLFWVLRFFPDDFIFFLSLFIFIIIGIIIPFLFLEIIRILSTIIVGCTLTMFGIDCIIAKGFLDYILHSDSRLHFIDLNIIFMIISSILLGLIGLCVQYRKHKYSQKKFAFTLEV